MFVLNKSETLKGYIQKGLHPHLLLDLWSASICQRPLEHTGFLNSAVLPSGHIQKLPSQSTLHITNCLEVRKFSKKCVCVLGLLYYRAVQSHVSSDLAFIQTHLLVRTGCYTTKNTRHFTPKVEQGKGNVTLQLNEYGRYGSKAV